MNRKSPVLVTTLVLALLAACGDDDDGASPDPPPSTTTAPEETTTSVDPFTVPDEITVEYVEAVLTELEKINGDALRLAVAEGMSPEVTDLLEMVLIGQPLADRATVLSQIDRDAFSGEVPGDIEVAVESIVEITSACVAADIYEDYRAVGSNGAAALAVRVELLRQPGNQTEWVVALRDLLRDGSAPEPCIGH